MTYRTDIKNACAHIDECLTLDRMPTHVHVDQELTESDQVRIIQYIEILTGVVIKFTLSEEHTGRETQGAVYMVELA